MPQNFPELRLPFVKSERYWYDEAIAMALADLEDEISNGLKEAGEDPQKFSSQFTVHVKDGGDGMGDVKRKQYQSKEKVTDKAIRYSF